MNLVYTFSLTDYVVSLRDVCWGYAAHNGPAQWEAMGEIPCCLTQQSPVNIDTSALEATALPALQFLYSTNVPLDVLHNGYIIKARVPYGSSYLVVQGKVFMLDHFHFHYKSEHKVDGQLRDVEMHLVHIAADGEITVVGVMFNQGTRAHGELAKVIDVMPLMKDDHAAVTRVNLLKLLPARLESYRYTGSLTMPPATQGVNWIVMTQHPSLSCRQVEAFRGVFSGADFLKGNRRPVQPLNGRLIYSDINQ